jgi:hypothetical protein
LLTLGLLLVMHFKSPLGASEIPLQNARVCADEAPFALQQYRWRNRVLVISAPDANDRRLLEQFAELTSTSDEFADRDMILVTLLDNTGSIADGCKLTSAEVAAARADLGIRPGSFMLKLIGKDGSVKLAASSTTPMKEIYALIDSMPMRQNEMSEG